MTTPAGEPSPTSPPEPAPGPAKNQRRRQVGWQSRDVVRGAALVMALYWLSRLFWFASPLVFTVFLGILFGLAVSSGVDRLERLRIPRGLGAALIVLTFIGGLVGFGISVAPTLREQGAELQKKIPEAIDRLEHWVAEKQRGPLGIVMGGAPPPDTLKGDSTKPAAPAGVPVPPSPAPAAAGTAEQAPAAEQSSLRSRLGAQFGSVTRYLFPFLHSTIAAMAGLLLIVFLAIYIAADPDLYHRGLIAMFPRRHRPRVGQVFTAIAAVLRKWLVTQLIAMTAIGVVTTIVLLILDVKAAFALGVIAGFLEFVPTVGPILSGIPAVAMAFLDSPQKALYVGIAYVAIQFVENHLLIPLLMKGGMDLPPALTILSQALMALVFGFIGLMCAVPLLAAGMVAFKMLYLESVIGERPFAKGQDPLKGAR